MVRERSRPALVGPELVKLLIASHQSSLIISRHLGLSKQPVGLALHLHQLEYVTWTVCHGNTIPPSALEFSKTQSGLPRYLGFVVEENQVFLGVVVGDKGIRLLGRDYGPQSKSFYVLATGKSWDL